jgi:hypothetical protein
MPVSNEKSNASHHTRNAPEESPAAQGTFVVDAGAAPVELIQRARPLSVDLTAFDAGPPRISAMQPRAEPGIPLNPLRAGAAIATGVTRSEANPQISDAIASADMEGGRAPERAVGKKEEEPSRGRKAKAKRTRSRKGKR